MGEWQGGEGGGLQERVSDNVCLPSCGNFKQKLIFAAINTNSQKLKNQNIETEPSYV